MEHPQKKVMTIVIKKQFQLVLILLLTSIFVQSCKEAHMKAETQATATDVKSTQAILKIQPFAYDSENKTRVDGEYVNKKKITVPKDLSGQNKWIMFEGPVLENDKIAYRFYADARHRFDIYGKKVSDLVMDTVSWDYHKIMDWGSDILNVGNSLGMGSPGIYYKDTIYTLSDWSSKEIEVIKEENSESIVRTTFKDLKIEEHTFDVVQDWSISAGNFWTEIHVYVVNGQLPEGLQFATGIVKHLPEAVTGATENGYFAYSWGEQSYHKQDLGMAIMTNSKYGPKAINDDLSHLYIFENSADGVKYRFMAQWKEGLEGPQSEAEFMKNVKESCKGI